MVILNKYNDTLKIIGNPIIGKDVWIGDFCIIDGSGGLVIGDECDISCGVHVYTHSTHKRCVSGKKKNYDGTVNREAIEKKPVSIGKNTFIGANTTILMGSMIGSKCIVGANSLINGVFSDNKIIYGIPAKEVGYITFDSNGDIILNYYDIQYR